MNKTFFCDVNVTKEAEPVVSYRTGDFVFEEGMRDGRWVALAYNASGYMMAANPNPAPPYLNYNAMGAPSSFEAVVDGQSLCSHFKYEGCTVTEEACGAKTARVTLAHTVRPVKVHIVTRLDGTPVIERHIEIENAGSAPAAVSAIAPIAGGVQCMSSLQFMLSEKTDVYRVGFFADSSSCREGNFKWQTLPDGIFTVAGRYRRDRHRHPMFILENQVTGECFIGQFAWSGGYAFEFDYKNENDNYTTLAMKVAVDVPAPIRMVEAGETWACPAIHLGAVFGGLDNAVNSMHRHLRKSVISNTPNGCLIHAAIGPEYDMSLEQTLTAVDYAEQIGAELFWIDAGWYLEPFCENDWWVCCGDWHENRNRYPSGVAQVREKCREKGLKFGMWLDAERIGPRSKVFREHPEWIETQYKQTPNTAGLLKVSDPECGAWMENEIARCIEEYQLDFYRLDWNVGHLDTININERDGYVENICMRHYQAVYEIYERLRKRFPNVIFENCAGGGGRTDVGMMKNFTETWITDFQLHPNAFRITNGLSMALPPEFINRLVGGQGSFQTAEINTQMRNLMFAYMSIGGITPRGALHNPRQIEAIRHNTDIYKNFVRKFIGKSNIYHHTPELTGNYAKGYGVLEMDDEDGSRGITGIFRLSQAESDSINVKLRGIDMAKTYRVTFDNSGAVCKLSGYELETKGVTVHLGGALTSELVMYEAE